jgi:diadenosine tetraphosphate (Ap4A) HIT family hydrolase
MDTYTLWDNSLFIISTPKNPHVPYSEGLHVIVSPKQEVANAWQDINLSEATFKLTAKACKIMDDMGIAPWFNIQANGNWGLLPGAIPSFHVHIYGRNKTASWGKPIILPEAPGTYKNESMPEVDRIKLNEAFTAHLT